jgi:hypothetical protein
MSKVYTSCVRQQRPDRVKCQLEAVVEIHLAPDNARTVILLQSARIISDISACCQE